MQTTGFVYLASPYTHPDPLVREERYIRTAATLATLLRNRVWTYSPIVHCHELAKTWGLPHDAKFWFDYDMAMLAKADSLSVLMLDGWHKSVGVKGEMAAAKALGLPITFIPGGGDVAAAVEVHPHKP